MSKAQEIIKQWALAQLNYRFPEGDTAWDEITKLTDAETCSAIAFLTGFSLGMGSNSEKKDWKRELRKLAGEPARACTTI